MSESELIIVPLAALFVCAVAAILIVWSLRCDWFDGD